VFESGTETRLPAQHPIVEAGTLAESTAGQHIRLLVEHNTVLESWFVLAGVRQYTAVVEAARILAETDMLARAVRIVVDIHTVAAVGAEGVVVQHKDMEPVADTLVAERHAAQPIVLQTIDRKCVRSTSAVRAVPSICL
jgi:hypothetical protein